MQLTNAEGEVTRCAAASAAPAARARRPRPLPAEPSHLQGMFYRTIRMLECGMKPVYVFDGKPPDLKSGEVRAGTRCRARRRAPADPARPCRPTS